MLFHVHRPFAPELFSEEQVSYSRTFLLWFMICSAGNMAESNPIQPGLHSETQYIEHLSNTKCWATKGLSSSKVVIEKEIGLTSSPLFREQQMEA